MLLSLFGKARAVNVASPADPPCEESCWSNSAAAPATCGEAIDVPSYTSVAPFPVSTADVIPSPGAKMSTHVPQLLKSARRSFSVLAPTVIASAADAGEVLQAFWFSFPAATTTMIPASTAALTTLFSFCEKPPPRDMLITDLVPRDLWRVTTQLIAAMTVALDVPSPSSPKTRTSYRLAPGATPIVLPAAVPATWVPCPSPGEPSPSFEKSFPPIMRPVNSEWLWRIPLSIM
mmetsp:Transcript_5690/g.11853  ORF Transcript_5690/g.11853 Transcript_5690/m.11853 type:complete len:233 (+) Transcript_5690:545-1243(+)